MTGLRRIAAILIVAGFMPATARAQTDARPIIEDAVKAHGGMETLGKYPGARIKVKGTVEVQRQPAPYSGQSVYLMPDRVKSTVTLTIQNIARTIETIQNGERSAMIVGGLAQHVAEAQAQELRTSLYCQNLARLVPLLKESKYTLTAAGEKIIDDKKVVGVRVASAGHKDVTLYFDAESHLLVMLERPGFGADGGKLDQQEFYSDFRTASGLKYAAKTKVVQNGKVTRETEVAEFQPLERVEAREFAIPP
jgi:hypothetical protein